MVNSRLELLLIGRGFTVSMFLCNEPLTIAPVLTAIGGAAWFGGC